MCRGFTINRFYCPPVSHLQRLSFPCVNHGFNTDYKSFLHFWTCTLLTPVSHFRLFMKFSSKSMTNKFSYYRVPSAFCFGLNCVRDVSNPVSGNCFLYSFLKRSSGIIEQPPYFLRYLTYRECKSTVAIPSV